MTNNPPQLGQLAMSAGFHLPLLPLCANGLWYLGTFSEEDGPMTRESVEYFLTKDAAQAALQSGDWSQRERS